MICIVFGVALLVVGFPVSGLSLSSITGIS